MLDKIILAPYYLTLKLRHYLYDHGIRKVSTCEVPTICVGNITAGGTGKTPHTEMILRTLLKSDEWAYEDIAVLSRGHLRASRGFQIVKRDGSVKEYGDEPLQIKKKFPGVTVAVDRHRVKGCDLLCHPEKLKTEKRARKSASEEIAPADLIVLDDAFQYRALRAYYNIILVDFNRPTYKDKLLPFGRLRDLPERFSAADIIIVSKCPAYLEDSKKIEWAQTFGLKDYDTMTCKGTDRKGKEKILLFTTIWYSALNPIFEEADPRYAYSQKLILFSGIAKDTPLRMYLSDEHKIVKRFCFEDHHKYTKYDVRRIMNAVREHPTAVVATTEKDCQRILDLGNIPHDLKVRLFQVPIEVGFLSEHEKEVFETSLLEALRNFHTDY
ncbi:MAG: tetraacyldisaccharide 4'-kinase [Bacteroidales bacterium]|jgi:tetraacyldisaccharide 4'-kinase|nr:tetraacyldisaccharide 4'-kinase [Bacteroidales bacterium]